MKLLPLLEIAARSTIVYVSIYLALRVAGKRHLAQLSLRDFVLVLLVSNAVQNAMVGSDSSLPGGLVAAGVLILANLFITRLELRSDRLVHLLEGEPTLLIRDGKVLEGHLMREGMRLSELEAAVREHGFANLSDVKQAILEIDGSISVCGKNGVQERRIIGPASRRRMPRRGYRPND
jgi:uncharacterized membrane protein YcaP (DUF421 family)